MTILQIAGILAGIILLVLGARGVMIANRDVGDLVGSSLVGGFSLVMGLAGLALAVISLLS